MTASPGELAVVHLVWRPLGLPVLEEFLDAYRRYAAGREHRLAVILNGFRGRTDARLAEFERALEAVDHEGIVTPRPLLDLAAYRHAAFELDTQRLCFLNSYSRPLVDDWLALLTGPLDNPPVGMSGIGGSYESAYTEAPFWLRRRRRLHFPPFPNPHLRTNGFALERELLLDLRWSPPRSKVEAWALESGKHSISRQVVERGLALVVVGRDGVAYPQERWRDSATFRSGGQHNLLVSDNRTRQYEQGGPAKRRRLEQMAWGDSPSRAPA